MDKPNKREIILTADGSHTVLSHKFNEIYHSKHGAIIESKHVFIKMGYDLCIENKDEISILEVGMGTGLNVFLTFLANQKKNTKIYYAAIEAFPLSENITSNLNYAKQLNEEDKVDVFKRIHTLDSGDLERLDEDFELRIFHEEILNFNSSKKFDLVYFDAFAPNRQAEMWKVEIFKHIYNLMSSGGILVTYCAKADVRRTMQSTGFQVERLNGPPGKREMLRARKIS